VLSDLGVSRHHAVLRYHPDGSTELSDAGSHTGTFVLADDVIYRGPQTREQVRGRDAYVRFNMECFADDGTIAGITDFWPDPYELPASRVHLVERY